MSAHRTVRAFRSDPVPEDHVRSAVAAAQMASTSSNVQAYGLLRVRTTETRTALAELCGGQRQVADAGAFFVVFAEERRHVLVAEAEGRAYEANLETLLVSVIDASLFAQNLALAFESQGYGIGFIGGLRNRLPEVDALLELPHGVFPLYGLCVGVPQALPSHRPRLPIESVLHEERYRDDASVRAALADYDRTTQRYYEERGKPGWTWSGAVSRKFQRPTREHLHAFYTSKGARFR